MRTKAGRYDFAKQDAKGYLKSTGKAYSPAAQAPSGTARNFRPKAPALRSMGHGMEQMKNSGGSLLSRAYSAIKAVFTGWHSRPQSGDRKLMVVRVNFVNYPLVSSGDFHRDKVWKEGEDVLSVREYYKDQSHGKLSVVSADYSGSTGGPFGMITINMTSADFNGGKHPDRLLSLATETLSDEVTLHANEVAVVNDVLKKVTTVTSVDFSKFDTNGDGTIKPDELCFYMIFAGYEESYSGYVDSDHPMIWAHAWSPWDDEDKKDIEKAGYDMSKYVDASHDVKIGSVRFSDWALNGERAYGSETESLLMQCVGVMTHELGHQMCRLPDLYDINGVNNGMDIYSLMAVGSWGAKSGDIAGARPSNLDAWSRIYLGWETPQTVVASISAAKTTFSKALTEGGIIRIESPAVDSSTEYILAEVRDPVNDKWDAGIQRGDRYDLAGLNSGALLLIHVDENVGSGNLDKGNDINTTLKPHQGIMPITVDCDYRIAKVRAGTNLWYSGNSYLDKLGGEVGALVAGKTYFYGDPQAYNAALRSGIALDGFSAPGDTITANVYYIGAATGAANPASAAYPEIDDSVAEIISRFTPIVFSAVSDTEEALEAASADIDSGDLTYDAAHQVTLTKEAVRAVANRNYDSYPLPIFKNSQSTKLGRLACSFAVASADLMAETPERVRVLKVTGKTSSRYFKYTDDPDDFVRDGYFTIQTNDDSGTVVPRGSKFTDDYYRVTLFITDNGDYDLDPTTGMVLDPAAIVQSGGSGSGGCSAGFGAFALMLVLPLAMFNKKRHK